jgi:hypothetical protein
MGGEFAARAGGTTAVWLPVSAARAYAALGNAEQATAAIHRAEDAWDQVQPDEVDELGGICIFNQPRTLYYAADALAWLPDEAPPAQDYSTRAVEAYANTNDPAWAFGDQAGSHADLAIARIAGRDIEGAADALAPVLDLPTEQRINGVVHSVQRVHQSMTRAGLAGDAGDLVDGIEDFTHTPVREAKRALSSMSAENRQLFEPWVLGAKKLLDERHTIVHALWYYAHPKDDVAQYLTLHPFTQNLEFVDAFAVRALAKRLLTHSEDGRSLLTRIGATL